VTTLGDPKRWTFPKGRRDNADDTLADAAAREAREEAGVAGKLEGRRLAEYRFPAANGKEHVVAAFLLEVKREKPEKWRKGDDATRERAWCSRDEALELLEGGDALYHSEMVRVIDAALQELREPEVS
jgi:8-oxo-dGTP pyrophosphatase MutT (NUDIX family)